MKNVAGAVLSIALIASASLCVALWHKSRSLEAENQELLAKVNDLEQSAGDAKLRSKASSNFDTELQSQKRELMRLRDEVTQLRSSRDAAARAQGELAKLQAQQSRGASASTDANATAGQSIRRDDWKFSGYATPEAAFISGMWAMKEGQSDTLLNSFTPQEKERFQAQMPEKSDAEIAQRFQKQYGNVTGVRIVGENQTAPGEVVLDVYLEGIGALKKYRMNQVGDEWKAGGPVNQNPAPNPGLAAAQDPAADPLAFYRRNPELMKRYFPQLYQQEQQKGQAQPPAPQEAPPAFEPK